MVTEALADLRPAKASAGLRAKRSEHFPFLLLIGCMPIQGMAFLSAIIVPLPGFKLSNIIIAVFFLTLITGRDFLRTSDRLERRALLFFGIYLAFFFVTTWRSLSNIGIFSALFPEDSPATPADYILYEFVIPTMFASSFVYILKRMNNPQGLMKVFAAIGIGVFALSTTLLVAVLMNPQYLNTPEREGMTTLSINYIGMHYTNIGTIYLMTAPILLYLALRRGGFWTLNFFLAVIGVIVDQARTGLLLFAFGSLATLIIMGRGKTLLRLIPLFAGGLAFGAGAFLIKLLSQGIAGKYGFTWYYLLSGRSERIWIPLLLEWFTYPSRFWIGTGLHGIKMSDSVRLGLILPVGEAHNMFLEVFLDGGVLLLAVIVVAVVVWYVWAIRLAFKLKSRVYSVLVVCFVSFLIACMTGRHFFPNIENMLMFPIMGALINAARLKLYPPPHSEGPVSSASNAGIAAIP